MKLIAMMLVKNEEDRYLREVLYDLEQYVDEITILDDCSQDNTVAICKSFKKVLVFDKILRVSIGQTDEQAARETLYRMTIERNPDWILAIDADDMFENKFKNEVRKMMESSFDWYSFNFHQFWTPDSYARISKSYMIQLRRLFRYRPEKPTCFCFAFFHCGSTPQWILQDNNGKETDIRVKHFGFIRKEDRLARIQINRDTGGLKYADEMERLEKLFEKGQLKLTKWE